MSEAAICDALDLLRSESPTITEFCRTIILPDGADKGSTYDPSRHPAQQIIIDAVEAGATHITICKPVQDGGSLIAFALMLWRVVGLSQTAIMAYPTQAAGKDAWTKKLTPILAAIGKLPQKGGGSGGGAATAANIPGGGSILIRSAGGRHESGQASATADVLIPDEVDDWPDMRRVKLIEQRISKSPDPMVVYISTVKRDGEGKDASNILRLLDAGTKTRIEYPCPHCAEFQTLDWESVHKESQQLACKSCGVLISEGQRLEMLRNKRRKDGAHSTKFSILWTALDSPFPIVIDGKRMPVVAGLCTEWKYAEDQIAINDHSFARQFYRDRLCRKYVADLNKDEDGQTIIPTTTRLMALASQSNYGLEVDRKEPDGDSVHLCDLPAFLEYQAIGVDVQRGGEKSPPRLYHVLIGWSEKEGKGALTGWGSLIMCPAGRQATDGEISATLDRLNDLLENWNPSVPIIGRDIDINDGADMAGEKRAANEAILRWLRGHPKWRGIRGTQPIVAERGDLNGWMYHRKENGLKIDKPVTSTATRSLHGELISRTIIMPNTLGNKTESHQAQAIIKHFCATVEYQPGQWSEAAKDRKHHPEWQRRHDYLDAAAYARARLYWWAKRKKPDDTTPQTPTPSAPAWINGGTSSGAWATEY